MFLGNIFKILRICQGTAKSGKGRALHGPTVRKEGNDPEADVGFDISENPRRIYNSFSGRQHHFVETEADARPDTILGCEPFSIVFMGSYRYRREGPWWPLPGERMGMFLITELILFSPLIIYSCFRVRNLIPRPGLKTIFVFFCILLCLGYPIAEVLSHRDISRWARYPVLLGYLCLPYLLYLTLSVAAFETVIALARSVRLLSKATTSNVGFRSVCLACYLLLPALIVFAGVLNNTRLQVREYFVDLPQKSSGLSELKIVFASDFHLGQLTNDRLLERFVAKVNALQPDIILIGGDILEGHGNENPGKFEVQFFKLKAKYGVYAVPGNHESHGSSPHDFFAKSGMKLLEDRVEMIDKAFYLAGRKNGRLSKRKPIGDLLKNAPADLPIILFDHSPTDLENVSRSRVDLQFSGHTHNGQLFPVNLIVMPFQYELAWGTRIKRNVQFFVSSGVQAWGPPVKTAGNSEILYVKARFRTGLHRSQL